MARILVIRPPSQGVQTGNEVTATRWRSLLEGLGHRVEVSTLYTGQDADLLIVMHAIRGASCLQAFRQDQPAKPVVLVLTGTDVNGGMEEQATSVAALCAATRIVLLQSSFLDHLDPEQKGRARVIPQSTLVPAGLIPHAGSGLQICVMGHLRDVKDPLRMAKAARLLPDDSKVRVVHLGAALEPSWARAAEKEEAENPRYTWLREKPRAEALQVMAASHCHVITSFSEGGPNAVLEAAALEVPSITSAIDGILGFFGADYPGKFPPGDTQALADLVGRFEHDHGLREDLRGRARELTKQFAPRVEQAKWRELLAELGIENTMMMDDTLESSNAQSITSDVTEFAEDVGTGLNADPKWISCRWLYDAAGSAIFEEICATQDYYVTRAEVEILETCGPMLSKHLADDLAVVELGSGSAVKASIILRALFGQREQLLYVPVDISGSAIEAASEQLLNEYSSLEITPVVGDYDRGFEWMKDNRERSKLVLWLGSNLGNFDRRGGASFLGRVSENLTGGDHVLLGIDFRKDAETLERAYDDTLGVTARFNLNILTRINRELGGRFDLDGFRHEARYDADEGRVILGLRSQYDQQVRIERLRRSVSFDKGEFVHTEDSFKYSEEEVEVLAASAGLRIKDRWTDSEKRFGVFLLARADS